VYAVAAHAGREDAVSALRALGDGGGPGGGGGASTWHVVDGSAALRALCEGAGVAVQADHARLVRRLNPGPARFELELSGAALERARASVGVLAGACDDGSMVAFRAPDHEAARAVLSRAGVPVIANGAAAVGLSATGRELDESAVESALASGRLAAALDDGATRLGKPSTSVRLLSGGGAKVTAVGAYEARFVEKQLTGTVLFVCTGNTCRSPMAAAIAEHLLRERGDSASWRVRSAGVSAMDGAPASAEVGAALSKLGIGMPNGHRSRALTSSMLREAEVVFTMTREHADRVRSMLPPGVDPGVVRPLDPSGDVPDPIGMPQSSYDETASRVRELVRAALEELEP